MIASPPSIPPLRDERAAEGDAEEGKGEKRDKTERGEKGVTELRRKTQQLQDAAANKRQLDAEEDKDTKCKNNSFLPTVTARSSLRAPLCDAFATFSLEDLHRSNDSRSRRQKEIPKEDQVGEKKEEEVRFAAEMDEENDGVLNLLRSPILQRRVMEKYEVTDSLEREPPREEFHFSSCTSDRRHVRRRLLPICSGRNAKSVLFSKEEREAGEWEKQSESELQVAVAYDEEEEEDEELSTFSRNSQQLNATSEHSTSSDTNSRFTTTPASSPSNQSDEVSPLPKDASPFSSVISLSDSRPAAITPSPLACFSFGSKVESKREGGEEGNKAIASAVEKDGCVSLSAEKSGSKSEMELSLSIVEIAGRQDGERTEGDSERKQTKKKEKEPKRANKQESSARKRIAALNKDRGEQIATGAVSDPFMIILLLLCLFILMCCGLLEPTVLQIEARFGAYTFFFPT